MTSLRDPKGEELLPSLVLPVGKRDHHINPLGARHTLVEYGDYECLDCAFGHHVVRELLRDFGNELCYVFRNFPQPDIHPHAVLAAEAAEAAEMQGKFWLMHDRLFEHQSDLTEATIARIARELPLEMDHFETDLKSDAPARRVADDRDEGVRLGVEATPTFFVNGRMHVGSYEYDPLKEALLVESK